MLKSSIKVLALVTLCSFFSISSYTQNISGYVQNEDNAPVPFAQIYIQELGTGTVADVNGRYSFTFKKGGGEFTLTISNTGYETKQLKIIIEGDDVKKNFWLKFSVTDLDEIMVKASRRDSAYWIIEQVVANKKKYLKQVESFKSQVYVKATEVKKETEPVNT